jgi:hypothetical protein
MSWFTSLLGKSSRGAAPEKDAATGAARDDHRYDGRIPSLCKLRLSWQDQEGKNRRKRVRVVDMSGTGMLVECGVPIIPGSFVFVKTEELGMLGSAYVLRCDPLTFSYRIGLQFASPLTLLY